MRWNLPITGKYQEMQIDLSKNTVLVDCATAAKLLAISARHLWSLTASRQIRCIRIGRSVRYSPADLQAFVDSRREGGAK